MDEITALRNAKLDNIHVSNLLHLAADFFAGFEESAEIKQRLFGSQTKQIRAALAQGKPVSIKDIPLKTKDNPKKPIIRSLSEEQLERAFEYASTNEIKPGLEIVRESFRVGTIYNSSAMCSVKYDLISTAHGDAMKCVSSIVPFKHFL